MCGIVGAAAQRNVVPILLEGLRRLEYRGYDSAGLATLDRGLHCVRSAGRVNDLAALAQREDIQGRFGIAHTRWATHGAPTERNAHPHLSCGQIAVVHNGIIENHEALRQELVGLGYAIASDTDTEVIAHLIHYYFQQSGNLLAATQATLARLHGAYAIAVLAVEQPDRLVAARKGSPLLLGVGIEEHFVASDVSALLPVTNQVVYLEEGDVVEVQTLGYQIYDAAGNKISRPVHTSELSADMAELGNFRHFMQKEIHEQPRALADTLENVLGLDHLNPGLFGAEAEEVLGKINSVHLLACGTSFHAARVAQYWLEGLAGIPTTAEVASEYRYRDSVANPDALVVVISQSGETADTLAALQHAQSLGHRYALAICNVAESALVRAANLRFLTHAGPEIGVASTKAFTTQLAALFLLTVSLGKLRGRIDMAKEKQYLQVLRELPGLVQQVLALEPAIANWAEQFTNKQHALFLGRGVHYPIAMEGALKLKEISYIHAEAYPAGELKHGPLALVDKDMPVIAIAPNDALLEKLKSNLMEVRARGGELYVFADADTQIQEEEGVHILKLPVRPGPLSPILHTVPLQLLSYHAALNKGTDVDKPRNLAKSVTVE